MKSSRPASEFDRTILPHLPSAYNLARWMLGTSSAVAAEDVVQDSCVRAFRHFDGYRGGDPRAWFLAIVRNCALTLLRRSSPRSTEISLDDLYEDAQHACSGPENEVLMNIGIAEVHEAIGMLPVEFREVIVLRDMEEFSYREISEIAGIPVGTVMSRLNRGRRRLRAILSDQQAVEADDAL